MPMLCFSPTTPLHAAGIRVEPPPSVAIASGAIPLATATAAPPLEPPLERAALHALRVRPNSGEFGQALAAEFGRRGLADQDRALGAEAGDRHSIFARHIVLVGHRAKRGSHTSGVDDVLDGEGNAVEQADLLACHELALGNPRLRQCLVAAQRDEAIQFRLQTLCAGEHRAHDLDGGHFLADNTCAKISGR